MVAGLYVRIAAAKKYENILVTSLFIKVDLHPRLLFPFLEVAPETLSILSVNFPVLRRHTILREEQELHISL